MSKNNSQAEEGKKFNDANNSRSRPTLSKQSENERTLQKFYNRGYTIAQVRAKTGFNEKTISKYFHKFDEEVQSEEKSSFVERELRERRTASHRLEGLILEEYEMLDELSEDIKKARKESSPQLEYFLTRKSDTIKTISALVDKKVGLCILPTAGESLENTVLELIEKHEERRANDKK